MRLTDKEIALIQALTYHHPEGMTTEFDKVCTALHEKLKMHRVVGNFHIWE